MSYTVYLLTITLRITTLCSDSTKVYLSSVGLLLPPGQHDEWLIGVRAGKKQRLYGFIAGLPVTVSANGVEIKMAEINFLCVH